MAVFPGFVDIQVNGHGGVDFSSPGLTVEAIEEACAGILSSGTAALLPTVITAPMEAYDHVLPLLSSVMDKAEWRPHLLGIHLEGPFISAEDGAVGCHRKECVQACDVGVLQRLQKLAQGRVRLLTIAADSPGAEELCRAARAMGITVALGHQLASTAQLAALADAGATLLTHLGNGMPNLVHRHNNPLNAGLAEDRLRASIITDGYHLPSPVIKNILRCKGLGNVVVVSDAAPVAGLKPGRYKCFGKEVAVEDGPHGACVRDGVLPCLAGSGASMLQCMNFLHRLQLVPAGDLRRLGCEGPLEAVGLDPAAVVAGLAASPRSPRVVYDEATGFALAAGQVD